MSASIAAPISPANVKDTDSWYDPAKYSQVVSSVVTKSCMTAKVFAGVWFFIILLGALFLMMVSPVYALGYILSGLGFVFIILMNYDMACKLGYERFMQIAFGFILLGMVIMAVTTGTVGNMRPGPAMLTPAMVASKSIQAAHKAKMAARGA